jgi:hypothetical protein
MLILHRAGEFKTKSAVQQILEIRRPLPPWLPSSRCRRWRVVPARS